MFKTVHTDCGAAARTEKQRQREAEDRRRQQDAEVRRVEAERREMDAEDPWWPIPSWEVPAGVRFDVPRRNQGQIVEVSFGTFGRAEADSIDPYMRVTDHSDGQRRTYKRRSI